MGAFEDFVYTELALRTGIVAVPTADRYPRFTGVGRAVEQRTSAQVIAELLAAASSFTIGNGSGDVTITFDGAAADGVLTWKDDEDRLEISDYVYMKKGIVDSNGAELLGLTHTADAVNNISITNAETGNAPVLSSVGDDADVDMNLATQGTGKVKANGNIIYHVSGTDVAIADGGTGQSTKTAGFDALSPTTTKGDIVASDGSNNVRKAAGSDGQVLIADDSQSDGLVWEDDIHSWPVEIPSPATDDEYLIRPLPYNVTFTEVYHHIVEGTGTVSFDIIRRSRSSSGTGGTDITSSPMQATTTGTSVTSFANSGDGDANEWLILKVTATTGSPEKLRLEYRHKRRK